MYWGDLSKYRSQIYALSILWIVVFHVMEIFLDKFPASWFFTIVFNNGNIGVDIFLFLSGISMFYSMKRYEVLNGKNLADFYKRRFGKILKVYIVFCIPYLLVRDVFVYNDVSKFISQVLFFDRNVSSFWFLIAILICYFIYPAVEFLLRKKKNNIIVCCVVVYIIGLCYLRIRHEYFYGLYEILLTRIPIFVIGALFSKKVYLNKKITLKEFSFFMLMIFMKTPIVYAMSRVELTMNLASVFSRLLMGWMGIGIIFIMIMIVKEYENSSLDYWVKRIGTFTLEIYVFHIAFRYVLMYGFKLFGVDFNISTCRTYRYIILFGILFFFSSIIGGYVLSLITKKKIIYRR